MTNINKQEIATALGKYCQQVGSQNKAANTLQGVSSATISQILNGKWDLINADMWRKVASQIDYDPNAWVIVEIRGFKRLNSVLADAQENSLCFGTVGDSGCGKSTTIKHYAASNPNVMRLTCSEFWNKGKFMKELVRSAGLELGGMAVSEMMDSVVANIRMKEKPLIIIDEVDKLSDPVLFLFITLYNMLEDHCGLVIAATDFLEKRIHRGVNMNKKGYKEINSRLGRKFIPLQVVNGDDIAAVCEANGVTDRSAVAKIIEGSDCDLRRVKRLIHAKNKTQK